MRCAGGRLVRCRLPRLMLSVRVSLVVLSMLRCPWEHLSPCADGTWQGGAASHTDAIDRAVCDIRPHRRPHQDSRLWEGLRVSMMTFRTMIWVRSERVRRWIRTHERVNRADLFAIRGYFMCTT
ncbi:hypothetical protein C2E23DRAFT_585459 [Lenzites betulinus]|nr:hypothetical protein C2E23DRAFT_585459 [Lenzites betulinus]